jgi:hypothetical protein
MSLRLPVAPVPSGANPPSTTRLLACFRTRASTRHLQPAAALCTADRTHAGAQALA